MEELSNDSLLIVLNAITGIDLWPEFTKELSTRGFTKALLPIGDGVAIFIKREYDITFFKKTIEVYRESFIYGPNPIDYNTAYFLYALTKFTLARRKGIAVEIGTGRGFSTLWLVHAAKEVNSQVISIDNKCDRVSYTLKVMKYLKLDNYVEVLCSDARNYKHYRESTAFMFRW